MSCCHACLHFYRFDFLFPSIVPPPLFLYLFLKLFQMERRRERVSRGLLLITLLLLLLYNLLIFPRPTVEKPSNNEKGEYFTTGDSLDSQTRHSWAENKGEDVQNRDSEAKNKAKPDELESARQTNKLRLQHLERACEEVGNGQLYLLVQSFVAILKRIISWDRLILSISS